MDKMFNAPAERSTVAGLFRFGQEGLVEADDIVTPNSFCDQTYSIYYKILKHLIEADPNTKPDIASVWTAAETMGLADKLKREDQDLLSAIARTPINLENVRRAAGVVRKLEVARLIDAKLGEARDRYGDLTGEESLNDIIGIAENSIFDLSSLLSGKSDVVSDIAEGADAYFQNLIDNPVDQIGWPTGWKNFDKAIGGGLRPGTVNVLGMRPKTGKSFSVDNIGFNLCLAGIEVFVVDTEMQKEDHWNRLAANLSNVETERIETGQFAKNKDELRKVLNAKECLKNLSFTHLRAAGMPFEEILGHIRRWLVRKVGLDRNGKIVKPAVVFYDYLKLMDDAMLSKNIAEFQALGFIMSGLHNFMVKYGPACVAMVQLNRDGITAEDTSAISQSDRIIWLCTSFSIMKWKESSELANEMGLPPEARFTHKLIPIVSRYGKGLMPGDFIHMRSQYEVGRLTEGPTDFDSKKKGVVSGQASPAF